MSVPSSVESFGDQIALLEMELKHTSSDDAAKACRSLRFAAERILVHASAPALEDLHSLASGLLSAVQQRSKRHRRDGAFWAAVGALVSGLSTLLQHNTKPGALAFIAVLFVGSMVTLIGAGTISAGLDWAKDVAPVVDDILKKIEARREEIERSRARHPFRGDAEEVPRSTGVRVDTTVEGECELEIQQTGRSQKGQA